MANIIKQKRGTTDPAASDLVVGELAINTTDGGVFTKTDGGAVIEIAGLAVESDTTGITGASAVDNIVMISQANYDAISSPDANTIYYVTS
jgi:hypothetical protein